MRALALVLLVAATAHASPSKNPEADLMEGRVAYQRHEYQRVVDRINPLLYPTIELPSDEAVVEAHRLLALAYFFQQKMPEAQHEVVQILSLRPEFQLDPMVEQPVAVRFFEETRAQQKQKLEVYFEQRKLELQRQQREEEERRHARAERIYVEKEVVRHSRLYAAVPFGVGQWQNGHKKLAVFFAVTEALAGTLSLACFVSFYALQPSGTLGLALSATTDAAGAAFWGLVLAGIIDAQVRFKPEVVRVREIPRPRKISLSPIISPGMFGLGAQGAF